MVRIVLSKPFTKEITLLIAIKLSIEKVSFVFLCDSKITRDVIKEDR